MIHEEICTYEVCKLVIEFDLTKYSYKVKDGKLIISEKKPKYPTTCEECCKLLNTANRIDIYGYKGLLLQSFQKLLICRDAYWKIAGDELELGKPWEPNWNSFSEDSYPTITKCNRRIVKTSIYTHDCPLTFPTEEMRDVFYDNFKDLIESCKELL